MIDIEKVKTYRKKLNLTQAKLAEIIQISTAFYSEIETGKKIPSVNTFVALATALRVTVNDLLVDCAAKHSADIDFSQFFTLVSWLTRWTADMATQIDEGREVADIIVDFMDPSRWNDETIRLKRYIKDGLPNLERLVGLMREVPDDQSGESAA
jgi:transcriptional regulator with XRE-family HTH domain